MYYPNLPKVKFVVNKDGLGEPADLGDSTFLTGIQAHILAMQGRFDKARILQNGPRKINYYRHFELLHKGTSVDMLLPWFLNNATWPNIFDAPDFSRRRYEFWPPLGRWMFYKTVLLFELRYRKYEHGNYFKNHLLMLRAATTYRRTRDQTLLGAMRKFVKRLEGATLVDGKVFPNPWFDYLCENNPSPCLWVDNAHEWPYQRDPRDGNRNGGIFGPGQRTFHRDRVKKRDGMFTRLWDMGHQFVKARNA